MLCQAGGPPFQVYVLPQRLEKLTLVGTMAIFFAAINLMKVIPYFALSQFSTSDLATSAALVPLAVATNFLGIWLVRITPTSLFYRLTQDRVCTHLQRAARGARVGRTRFRLKGACGEDDGAGDGSREQDGFYELSRSVGNSNPFWFAALSAAPPSATMNSRRWMWIAM